MNARLAPAANAAMMMPSISRCGFFWISRRSLKVPGSDSSALQQRYLSIEPLGMKLAFLPIEKPAPPRPRRPEFFELLQDRLLVHLGERLAQRLVAAEALVDVDPVQVRLVDAVEQQARLIHRRASSHGSLKPSSPRPRPGSGWRPSFSAATISGASLGSSGPTKRPSIDAIGAMSQAPRHSKARMFASS